VLRTACQQNFKTGKNNYKRHNILIKKISINADNNYLKMLRAIFYCFLNYIAMSGVTPQAEIEI
jgi:hypothetical protein